MPTNEWAQNYSRPLKYSLIQLPPLPTPKAKALQNQNNKIPPLPKKKNRYSFRSRCSQIFSDQPIWALGGWLTLRQSWSTVLSWKILCHVWTTSGRKDFTMKTCPGLRTPSSDQVLMTLMALRRPPSISSRDSTWIIAALPRWDQEDMLLSRFKGELSSSLYTATSSPAARRSTGEGFSETPRLRQEGHPKQQVKISPVSQALRGEFELHLHRN